MKRPIDALIDKACGVQREPQVRSSDMVLLRCPDCKRKRRVQKHETDPRGTVEIILTCPECDHRRGGGTFDDPCYLDKNGKQLKAQ